MPNTLRSIAAAAALTAGAALPALAQTQATPVIGRWDLTVTTPGGTMPSWLEVSLSGQRIHVGRFVGSGGSARPISRVLVSGDSLRFTIPGQWDADAGDLTVEAVLRNDRLAGTMSQGGRTMPFTGVRSPRLERTKAPVWGPWTPLFNGKDLTGWHPSDAAHSGWQVVQGILTDTKPGANLITDEKFTDFQIHAEVRLPKDGNSGIYLRGRHEVQVGRSDMPGEDVTSPTKGPLIEGSVYGFLPPNQLAGKPAGEWNTYDITLVGRLVTVVLNGKTIISQAEIPGITGGALDANEGEPGPIYLQGDHTSVEYRNIRIRRARP